MFTSLTLSLQCRGLVTTYLSLIFVSLCCRPNIFVLRLLLPRRWASSHHWVLMRWPWRNGQIGNGSWTMSPNCTNTLKLNSCVIFLIFLSFLPVSWYACAWSGCNHAVIVIKNIKFQSMSCNTDKCMWAGQSWVLFEFFTFILFWISLSYYSRI